MNTTVGQLLVNEALPHDLRDYERVLTSKDADAMLEEVARRYPERYRDISKQLIGLGREASFVEGATLSLSDMVLPVEERAEMIKHVQDQTRKIMADKSLSKAEQQEALAGVYAEVRKFLTDQTYERGVAADNPFALQVLSRARGNPAQLTALMTTPGNYTDASDNIIPIFINHSYAEGLDPHEYWAGTYGARKSVISTKFATRDAGYLGKQFNQAAMRTIVSQSDCETAGGIPVDAGDDDNVGAVLARKAGKYPAGTVISKEVLADLQDEDLDEIVVRSPLTCNANNGVCKLCVGHRESGRFPKIGDHVGINAASALAERIAQGSLNVKHSGGLASNSDEGNVYAGFDVIEQLFQVPKTFPHRATVANKDGRIDAIEEAPQGGWNITIDDEVHYVLPEVTPRVKVGDRVEAGDQLSTGILNPRDVVRYKGVGEGRRYFTRRATQAFRDSGYAVNRRNMEVLVRGLIDHAKVTDPKGAGNFLPDDVVSYNSMAHSFKPRKDAAVTDLNGAVGMYLEQPVLHYSIGTRITKNIADQLGRFGHNRVMAHRDPPPFEPYMVSLREVPQHEKDWMAQLGSSYLKSNLLQNVHTGAKSEIHSTHPVPGIARGTEFGDVPKGKAGY
jgi:DNA-directed RNA polymerase subunit beta'